MDASRSRKPIISLIFLLLAVFFVVGRPMFASADDASEARKRYSQGRKALAEGRFREAALHFEAVTRLKKHAAGPFAAAAAWEKADEPVRAADNYAIAVTLPGLKPKAMKQAKKRLQELEATMGTVVITGPENLVVQFEGSTEVHPPARLHALPGISTLLIAREDKVERRDIRLSAGEVKELDVTEPLEPKPEASASAAVSSSAPPPPPPPPPKPKNEISASTDSASTRKILGYSAIGAGVVSAGAAVVLGFKTLSARDDFEKDPTRAHYDDAVSLRLWTNVAWAGAVVLGGAGAALLFWPSSSQDKDAEKDEGSVAIIPSPTGLQVQGTF